MTFAPAIFMRKCTGPREAQACFSRPRQGREGSGDVPQTTEEAALAADAPPISANEKRARRTRFSWRWAESNRRPNKAPEGFLHAYPAFDCRGTAAGGRANVPLASES